MRENQWVYRVRCLSCHHDCGQIVGGVRQPSRTCRSQVSIPGRLRCCRCGGLVYLDHPAIVGAKAELVEARN
jgi:hypothetical protein